MKTTTSSDIYKVINYDGPHDGGERPPWCLLILEDSEYPRRQRQTLRVPYDQKPTMGSLVSITITGTWTPAS